MNNKLPDEFYPFVDKIINNGKLDINENSYFKSLIEKYSDEIEPEVKPFLENIILQIQSAVIPEEVRDKLLLYISGII